MKRIKYLGVLLSIVTLCVACEKSEKDGLGGFHKNFVECRTIERFVKLLAIVAFH